MAVRELRLEGVGGDSVVASELFLDDAGAPTPPTPPRRGLRWPDEISAQCLLPGAAVETERLDFSLPTRRARLLHGCSVASTIVVLAVIGHMFAANARPIPTTWSAIVGSATRQA